MIQPAIWGAPQFLRTQAESALWNALLSYEGQPLVAAGSDASFRLTAAEPPASSKSALLVRTDRGPAFLTVIESFPFDQMFGIDLEQSDLMGLPAPLRSCLEEGIITLIWRTVPHKAALGQINSVTSGSISYFSTHTDYYDDYKWLHATIDGIAPIPVTLLIGFSLPSFVHLISNGALSQSAINQHLAAAIDTEAHHTLGSIGLTYRELSRLEPGDLVVLPNIPADQRLMRAGDIVFTLSETSGQFLCVNKDLTERYKRSPSDSEESRVMNETIDQPQDAVETVEELPVVIDFDIGRQTVSLAELQSWRPGAAVLIEPPALDDNVNVTVRANGQVIGTGDLVRIDERVAVRLTHLSFRSETSHDRDRNDD